MEKLIKKFNESSLLVKALLLVPIIFVACFYGLPDLFNGEERKRKKVDSKDAELDKKIDKTEQESASHQGEVSRLEKEKSEQLESLKRDDPAGFHNRRKKK